MSARCDIQYGSVDTDSPSLVTTSGRMRDKAKSQPDLEGCMRAKPEYRNRDETEVVVLDALADRHQEGMTVFEIRSRADVTIDQIEDALAALKDDNLIVIEKDEERTLILPEEDVVGPETTDGEVSLFDKIRGVLPF